MALLTRWLIKSAIVFIGLISTYSNSSRWVLIAYRIGISTVTGLSLSPIGDLKGLGVAIGN